MSDEPKTFCKAPFKTAVIDTGGQLIPCCEFMTNESSLAPYKLNAGDEWIFNQWWKKGLDPLREKMLKGEVDPGCRYCLSKEKNAGVNSLRISTNKSISDTFEEIKNDYLQNKREYPKQVELRLGNYCNLKCIMCGPYASSSIMTEYKKHKKEYNNFGIKSNWGDPNMPKDWYTYKHNKETLMDVASKAIWIHFGGGEPFISPIILEVLEVISPSTRLRFNTNMTRINDKVLEALKKFDHIEILASIDGVGAHNEYYRSGSRWDLIVENFKKLKSYKNIKLNIGYVLQHTSLYTLKDVMAFVNDMDLPINFGEVYYGSVDGSGHLTINSALEKDIDNFKKWLDSGNYIAGGHKNTIHTWLDSYESNALLHARFKKYVKMLDSIRGTDFAKTFNPSWA